MGLPENRKLVLLLGVVVGYVVVPHVVNAVRSVRASR